jgi:flavin-binding protein dodecin
MLNSDRGSFPVRSEQDPVVQGLVDDFFKRFPSPHEAHLRETFATKRARIVSADPAKQSAIDAIYNAMARADQSVANAHGIQPPLPPGITGARWKPNPATAALIQQFLDRFPPDAAAHYRKIIFSGTSSMRFNHDPASQKLLDAIYRARDAAPDEEWEISTGR